MIKVDFRQWILDVWRCQTWFGYTYFTISSSTGQFESSGKWYKNNSQFVKNFNQLTQDEKAEAADVGISTK